MRDAAVAGGPRACAQNARGTGVGRLRAGQGLRRCRWKDALDIVRRQRFSAVVLPVLRQERVGELCEDWSSNQQLWCSQPSVGTVFHHASPIGAGLPLLVWLVVLLLHGCRVRCAVAPVPFMTCAARAVVCSDPGVFEALLRTQRLGVFGALETARPRPLCAKTRSSCSPRGVSRGMVSQDSLALPSPTGKGQCA
jgi:hypothetical protein